jgi:putative ABC transport system permease protein
MRDVLYLAWRYLVYHRIKTGILVTSIMLIIYLPVGLNVVVEQSAEHLTARAAATPLLVGAKGSPLELALNSLYFSADHPELIDYSEATSVLNSGLANAIPLYVRFRSRSHPLLRFSQSELRGRAPDGGIGRMRRWRNGRRDPGHRARRYRDVFARNRVRPGRRVSA